MNEKTILPLLCLFPLMHRKSCKATHQPSRCGRRFGRRRRNA